MTFTDPGREETLATRRLYEGRVIALRVDEARLPNGLVQTREVIEHPGGVVVLPVLDDGRILFVRQYRYALGQPLLELPAGKLEPGEQPDVAIRRELAEETGYEADHWEELSSVFTAPGFCNERLWLYRATGLRPAEVHVREEDEFIDVHALTPQEVLSLVKSREIIDAKTLCLLGLMLIYDPDLLSG